MKPAIYSVALYLLARKLNTTQVDLVNVLCRN